MLGIWFLDICKIVGEDFSIFDGLLNNYNKYYLIIFILLS